MKEFSRQLIKELLAESQGLKVQAIYPGRFQPMGKHHAATYQWMVKKFGPSSVMVSSDKQDPVKSPFSFQEKQKMAKMMGIKKFIKSKQPYKADIMSDAQKANTAVVFVVGKKDAERLNHGNYFREWKGKAEGPASEMGYYVIAPHVSLKVPGHGEMSGTSMRKALGDTSIDSLTKKKLFKSIFGKWDANLYKMMISKLEPVYESIMEFAQTVDLKVLLEANTSDGLRGSEVDDGPGGFHGNMATYKKFGRDNAAQVGFEVVNYLIPDMEFETFDTVYPNGPVDSVTFFPAGVAGKTTSVNQVDISGHPAYKRWLKHVTNKAALVGWTFLNNQGAEDSIKSSKNEPNKELRILSKSSIQESTRKLISEGGAAGHMQHPFDNKELTFGEFKKIIDMGLSGNLDVEESNTEKTDGQNLMVSFKDGKIVAARNKTQIKTPITTQEVAKIFKGRGTVRDAFVFAMQDLGKAMKALPKDKLDTMFNNGQNFMNLEIIYPENENVINYDLAVLQFHGMSEFDEKGKLIDQNREHAKSLTSMIKSANADMQKHFKIIEPNVLKIAKHSDFTKQKSKYIKQTDALKKQFKLKDSDTLALYHQKWWEKFIDDQGKKLKFAFPKKAKDILVRRWAFGEKKPGINDVKKLLVDPKIIAWMSAFDKKDHNQQVKENMKPFETIIFHWGAQVLKNANTYLSANPEKSVQKLRTDLAATAKDIEKGGDPKKIAILNAQLAKLNSIGMDNLVPSEGVVFKYKGKTYKVTGAFAPINQILGALKFMR